MFGFLPYLLPEMTLRAEAHMMGALWCQRFAKEYSDMAIRWTVMQGHECHDREHAIHVQGESARYARMARIAQGVEP